MTNLFFKKLLQKYQKTQIIIKMFEEILFLLAHEKEMQSMCAFMLYFQ